MKLAASSSLLLILSSAATLAGTIDQALARLDPEERAHQACVIKGIDMMHRDGKLPMADRIKTGVLGRAAFADNIVTTHGGAVRSKSHWYRLSFTCAVTKDQMKATSFAYELGPEIPESQWEDLGLWR